MQLGLETDLRPYYRNIKYQRKKKGRYWIFFVFDESTTRFALFFGRQLNNSIQVVWGESSMIEAERLLFEEALYDPANQRFVLLSDS